MLSVRQALGRLPLETIYIPGGLTADVQTLDVGVNAPFKHWLCTKWLTRRSEDHDPNGKRVDVTQLVLTA
jgi:hypothetical protein